MLDCNTAAAPAKNLEFVHLGGSSFSATYPSDIVVVDAHLVLKTNVGCESLLASVGHPQVLLTRCGKLLLCGSLVRDEAANTICLANTHDQIVPDS